MINDFEVKMTPDSDWEIKSISVIRGIVIANHESELRLNSSIKLDGGNSFEIEDKKSGKGYKYYILTITSTKYKIQIRAVSRISLEYIIFHAMQKDPIDTGRPLTFYPHLSNIDAPLDGNYKRNNSFVGLFNLLLICLLLTHFRRIYDNLIQNGFILTPKYILTLVTNYKNFLFILFSFILVSICTLCTYLIECLASTNIPFSNIYIMHMGNIALLVFAPLFFHKWNIITPISGVTGLFIICVFSLKLISYAHFWYDVRRFIDQKERLVTKDPAIKELQNSMYKDIKEVIDYYPHNITLKNLINFLFKPVLCYQYKYPKTEKIHKRKVIFYAVSFLFCISLNFLIFVQFVIPAIDKSFDNKYSLTWLELIERILDIAIPNVYCWIVMFYGFFHLWLNLIAELTQFADRTFYKDWWNALYLDEYWRKWNIPTHYWLLRHVYNPLRRRKISRPVAYGITYFVSALFHEYICSGALGCFNYLAFLGIFINYPLGLFQCYLRSCQWFTKYKESQMLNVFFWILFCFIGQPLEFLFYTYKYYKVSTE